MFLIQLASYILQFQQLGNCVTGSLLVGSYLICITITWFNTASFFAAFHHHYQLNHWASRFISTVRHLILINRHSLRILEDGFQSKFPESGELESYITPSKNVYVVLYKKYCQGIFLDSSTSVVSFMQLTTWQCCYHVMEFNGNI